MALTVDQIIRLYRTEGASRYGMEAVSQEQHALQCAWLAQQSGARRALVVACLLHDLGHLLYPEGDDDRDQLHEFRALPFLRGEYPESVIAPIRLHVAAKRYLCAVGPGYLQGLSPASRRSLELQGGPFSPPEVELFTNDPHAADAIALRRWDDQAKSPTRETPGWEHWRELLESLNLHSREGLAA